MELKTIKVNTDIHSQVVEHTDKIGGKIGKFYDLAAQEKLERENKKPRKFKVEYQTK